MRKLIDRLAAYLIGLSLAMFIAMLIYIGILDGESTLELRILVSAYVLLSAAWMVIYGIDRD